MRRVLSSAVACALIATGLSIAPALHRVAEARPDPDVPAAEGYTRDAHWRRLPDGRVEVQKFSAPTFTQRSGSWRRMTGKVETTPDKALPFAAPDAVLPMRFGTSTNRLLELPLDRGTVRLSTPDLRVGRPELVDNTMVYRDVARDTDLVVEPTGTGFRTKYVLRSADAPRTFTMRLDDPTNALGGIREVRGQGYAFTGLIEGDLTLAVRPGFAYEQTDDDAAVGAEPGSAHLSVSRDGAGYLLTKSVDDNWLRGKTFPVVLDPPFYTGTDIEDVTDCHIVSGSRIDTNYCTSTATEIGYRTTDLLVRRLLYKFDFSDVPAGSRFETAQLQMFRTNTYGGTGSGDLLVDFYEVNAAWDTAVTWRKRNASTNWTTAGGTYFTPARASYTFSGIQTSPQTINLPASMLGGWHSNPATNRGILLRARSEAADLVHRFGSNENDGFGGFYRPSLSYSYTPAPAAPTNVQAVGDRTQAFVSWNASGTNYGADITEYRVTATCASTGCTNDSTVYTCGATCTTMTVPRTGGHSYTFSVKAVNGDGLVSPAGTSPSVFVRTNAAPLPPDQLSPPSPTASQTSPQECARYQDPEADSGTIKVEIRTPAQVPVAVLVTNPLTSATVGCTPAPNLADGNYVWDAVANDGLLVSPVSAEHTLTVDSTPPAAPAISSSTHPNPSVWYSNGNATLQLSAADTSGIAGFSYVVDAASATLPDTSVDLPGTTLSLSNLTDGVHWVHVRACNGTALCSTAATHYKLQVDRTAPSAPAITSNTHTSGGSSNNRTISVGWSAATDATSGLVGYATAFTTSATTVPDPTNTTTGTSLSSASLADGLWYFHLAAVDAAGNATAPLHVGPFRIDGVIPSVPVVSSSTHTADVWSPSRQVAFVWTATDDASGVVDYSYSFDSTSSGVPDNTPETTASSATLTAPEGISYFHIKARDAAGNWSPTAEFRLRTDVTAPVASATLTTTHPAKSNGATVDVTWSAASDPLSGVAGYSWLWSNSATAVPDVTVEAGNAVTSTTSAALADGTWYFHLVAVDGVGNVSAVKRVGPLLIDTVLPLTAVAVGLTPDQGADTPLDSADDIYFANPTITCTAGDDRAGIDTTQYRWDSGTWVTWSCGLGGALTIPSAGSHLLEFRSTDQAGNVELTKSRWFNFDPGAVAQSDEAGMEQFFPLHDLPLGTGTGYVHLRTGNFVAQYDDGSVPAQGLNTVLRRTYNSARRGVNSHGLGLGWSLSAADLDVGVDDVSEDGAVVDLALGSELLLPTQTIVNGALTATGYRLDFTDGDGTTHRFARRGGPGARWDSPPGVNLRVFEELDPNAQAVATAYRLVRPDGVEYRAQRLAFAASDGTPLPPTWRITSITDRRGNQLDYDYAVITTSTGAHVVRLAAIRHNRNSRTTARFDYTASTGNLASMTTLPGHVATDPGTGASRNWERTTTFDIDAAGQLRSVTELANRTVAEGRRTTGFEYDPADAGLLTKVTDARGYSTAIGYTGGKATTLVDRRGKATTLGYGTPDAAGTTGTTVTLPVAGATTTYRISGRTLNTEDNRIAGGNIVEITDAGHDAGAVRDTYTWSANRLVTHINGAGAQTSYTYTDLGLLSTVTEPAPSTQAGGTQSAVQSTLTYAYPDSGPGSYRYDSRCTEPSAPTGTVTGEGRCHAVAEMTRMAAAVNVPGQLRITDFQYDAVGNLTKVVQRANPSTGSAPSAAPSGNDRATAFGYYARGGLRQIDGPRTDVADVTTYGDTADAAYGGYDITGMPLELRDALGKTKQFGYTPYGLVARLVDRDGRVTRSEHTDLDNIVKVTDPLGRVTTYSYDANENKVSETSESGNATATVGDGVTTWTHDPNGWVTEVRSSGATPTTSDVESTTFFDDGTVATTTNARGAVTSYAYHPNRAQKSVTVPAGTGQTAVTSYEYDAAGRLSKTIEPVATAGGTRPQTIVSYSPAGLPEIEQHTDPSGGFSNIVRTAYNAHGETVSQAGPRAQAGVSAQSLSFYNALGDVTSTQRRLSPSRTAVSQFGYDLAGNQVSSTQATGDGGQLTSRYTFDALGQMTAQVEDPVNPTHQTRYTYTGEGQQVSRVDGVTSAGAFVPRRTVAFEFNGDNTQRSMVVTDHATGKTLASCNWAEGADPASGYDDDGNLLVSRTVTGTGGCAGGATLREQTFAYDARDWLVSSVQKVRARATDPFVTRTQTFSHEADGSRASFTHNGQTTRFTTSLAGWMETLTDWRNRTTTASYLPSGDVASSTVGGGVANGAFTYLADGSIGYLGWKNAAGTVVRSHSGIYYDAGALRTAETVNLLQPTGSTAATNGTATYNYDLADRLTGWTSPFKQNATDGATPATSYTLDDGGNITYETVTVSGSTRTTTTSTYTTGRLVRRVVDTAPLGLTPATKTETDFTYNDIGEESLRSETTRQAGAVTEREQSQTSYDPQGHTAAANVTATDAAGVDVPKPDVDYVYDTADRLIARIEKPTSGAPQTRLYFYAASSGALVEETDGSGRTLVRYLLDAGDEPLAQQAYRTTDTGVRDEADTTGTWTWLLLDSAGSVGTLLGDDGTVKEQNAFDPFGKADAGGTGRPAGQSADKSSSNLGFQSALTDRTTGNIVLGARQYDPTTARFTTPDFFVAGALDVELGTDALNGNRYLFASANPVAFFDDGHWGWAKKLKRLAKRALPVLAFVPVVSTAIDVVSAATGRDWLDGGRRMTGAERLMMLGGAALGAVSGGAGGAALRAGRMAAKSADKFKTARKAAKAASCVGGANSFTGDTPVLLADGTPRAIADVDIGDQVLATHEHTGETGAYPVIDLIRGHGVKHLVDIDLGDETVTATDRHPVYVIGRGFVDATDLTVGDRLRDSDGAMVVVHGLSRRDEILTVYNLTVDRAHTYYVGDITAVLVHNASRCKVNGNTVATRVGRNAHKKFDEVMDALPGYRRGGQIRGTRLRPDGFNRHGGPVELKPNNPRAIKRGKKQLAKYERATGKKGELWVYDRKPNNGYRYRRARFEE